MSCELQKLRDVLTESRLLMNYEYLWRLNELQPRHQQQQQQQQAMEEDNQLGERNVKTTVDMTRNVRWTSIFQRFMYLMVQANLATATCSDEKASPSSTPPLLWLFHLYTQNLRVDEPSYTLLWPENPVVDIKQLTQCFEYAKQRFQRWTYPTCTTRTMEEGRERNTVGSSNENSNNNHNNISYESNFQVVSFVYLPPHQYAQIDQIMAEVMKESLLHFRSSCPTTPPTLPILICLLGPSELFRSHNVPTSSKATLQATLEKRKCDGIEQNGVGNTNSEAGGIPDDLAAFGISQRLRVCLDQYDYVNTHQFAIEYNALDNNRNNSNNNININSNSDDINDGFSVSTKSSVVSSLDKVQGRTVRQLSTLLLHDVMNEVKEVINVKEELVELVEKWHVYVPRHAPSLPSLLFEHESPGSSWRSNRTSSSNSSQSSNSNSSSSSSNSWSSNSNSYGLSSNSNGNSNNGSLSSDSSLSSSHSKSSISGCSRRCRRTEEEKVAEEETRYWKRCAKEKQCQVCKVWCERGTRLCARCRSVGYCSRECQRKAWSVHKKVCAFGSNVDDDDDDDDVKRNP